MTIEKGKEWGQRVRRPDQVVVAQSDAELALKWSSHPNDIFRVVGGDVFTALGCPMWNEDADELQLLTIDVLRIETLNTEIFAMSSLQIGSWLSRGRYVCVSNTGFVGTYNIAPRAHPNDGEMDLVTVSKHIEWKQRLQARQRARLGHHVPHPHIGMERGTSVMIQREGRGEVLRVDGRRIRDWDTCSVTVISDACQIVV